MLPLSVWLLLLSTVSTVLNQPALLSAASVAAVVQQPHVEQPTVTYFMLPRGDSRCRRVARRLNCLDQSIIVTTQRPSESLLDAFVLCDRTTWAAVGCKSEAAGSAVAWQLAFLVTAPVCGDRLLLNNSHDSLAHWHSLESQQQLAESVQFDCSSHAYPYLYKPRYKYTRMVWYRGGNATDQSPVNVSMHVYARFRPDVLPGERPTQCAWSNGFWCHRGNATCVYATHRCNGYDDCMDGEAGHAFGSSDELECSYEHHDSSGRQLLASAGGDVAGGGGGTSLLTDSAVLLMLTVGATSSSWLHHIW